MNRRPCGNVLSRARLSDCQSIRNTGRPALCAGHSLLLKGFFPGALRRPTECTAGSIGPGRARPLCPVLPRRAGGKTFRKTIFRCAATGRHGRSCPPGALGHRQQGHGIFRSAQRRTSSGVSIGKNAQKEQAFPAVKGDVPQQRCAASPRRSRHRTAGCRFSGPAARPGGIRRPAKGCPAGRTPARQARFGGAVPPRPRPALPAQVDGQCAKLVFTDFLQKLLHQRIVGAVRFFQQALRRGKEQFLARAAR